MHHSAHAVFDSARPVTGCAASVPGVQKADCCTHTATATTLRQYTKEPADHRLYLKRPLNPSPYPAPTRGFAGSGLSETADLNPHVANYFAPSDLPITSAVAWTHSRLTTLRRIKVPHSTHPKPDMKHPSLHSSRDNLYRRSACSALHASQASKYSVLRSCAPCSPGPECLRLCAWIGCYGPWLVAHRAHHVAGSSSKRCKPWSA